MILTDEECLKGVKAEHSAMLFYARAIEAAVLAKLNSAEPVGYEFQATDGKWWNSVTSTIPLRLDQSYPKNNK